MMVSSMFRIFRPIGTLVLSSIALAIAGCGGAPNESGDRFSYDADMLFVHTKEASFLKTCFPTAASKDAAKAILPSNFELLESPSSCVEEQEFMENIDHLRDVFGALQDTGSVSILITRHPAYYSVLMDNNYNGAARVRRQLREIGLEGVVITSSNSINANLVNSIGPYGNICSVAHFHAFVLKLERVDWDFSSLAPGSYFSKICPIYRYVDAIR